MPHLEAPKWPRPFARNANNRLANIDPGLGNTYASKAVLSIYGPENFFFLQPFGPYIVTVMVHTLTLIKHRSVVSASASADRWMP